MDDVGKKIRELRTERGLTQAELGRSFGGTKVLIHKYEVGEIKNIPLDNIIAMAEALDVHPAYFLGMMDLDEAKHGHAVFAAQHQIDERECVQRLVVAVSHLKDAQVDALTVIAEQMRL